MPFDKIKEPIKQKVRSTKKHKDNSNFKWWNLKDENIYASVFGIVNKLNNGQTTRHLNNIKFARLYENLDVTSYALGFYNSQLNQYVPTNKPALNVVKSCIDTVSNKISKENPKIQFLTQKGDFKLQEKAKNLTQYLEGLFDYTGSYDVGQEVFKDSTKFGTGCAHIYISEDNNIEVERVLITEIMIDEAEGVYRKPRQILRRKLIQRDVLIDLYPEYQNQIEGAKAVNLTTNSNSLFPSDMVLCVEAWHLPSGSDSTDGKHAICVENCTLFAEQYNKNYFPFVFYRWNIKTIGFFGAGLAEELSFLQLEINKLLRMISIAQERMAAPKIFLEENSAISKDALTNNGIADIINYSGAPPVFSTPSGISPEISVHLQFLYQKAFEITGVSQLGAASKVPAGLNSGVALREYEEQTSERFIIAGQQYQKFYIELGKIMIDLSKDLYEDKKNISVKVVGNKFIETIEWKDVDMNEDEYSMRGFPISLLPSSPPGRLQKVQELVQAGFIPKEYAMSLLDFPDLDKFTSLDTAALNDIMMLIGNMLNDGVYTPPEAFMNLQLALTLTHSSYLDAKTKKNVKPENLQLLRDFANDIMGLMAQANPPPDQTQTGPPAQAAPAPTSDLVPQKIPQ